jgi:hypothetical protein
MQRVWVVVLSVWAMLAIVAVLAWSSRPALSAAPAATAQRIVVTGPRGKQRLVLVQPALGAAHAITASSASPRP